MNPTVDGNPGPGHEVSVSRDVPCFVGKVTVELAISDDLEALYYIRRNMVGAHWHAYIACPNASLDSSPQSIVSWVSCINLPLLFPLVAVL